MKTRRVLALAAIPVAALAAGCGAASTSSSPSSSVPVTSLSAPLEATGGNLELIPNLVEQLQPSIVSVLVQTVEGGGQGSGVVWDGTRGLIVTNNHVVEGATAVEVQLASGDQIPAEVVATDPNTDLAVIRVGRTDLPSAEFASELPRVGQLAVALGNPLGFENTVTAGIVSAVHRNLDNGGPYVDLIQTDAPISPGNSGGALVNAAGQVIGINSAGIPATSNANSLGFAIPSTTVRSIVNQLVEGGQAGLAFLGVSSENDGGALVTSVTPGSAADAAGLESGDVIAAVDGTPIGSTEELVSELRSHAPGDQVTLTVVRNGEQLDLQATLGNRADAA
jgi:S1-C subfamily serine protease